MTPPRYLHTTQKLKWHALFPALEDHIQVSSPTRRKDLRSQDLYGPIHRQNRVRSTRPGACVAGWQQGRMMPYFRFVVTTCYNPSSETFAAGKYLRVPIKNALFSSQIMRSTHTQIAVKRSSTGPQGTEIPLLDTPPCDANMSGFFPR